MVCNGMAEVAGAATCWKSGSWTVSTNGAKPWENAWTKTLKKGMMTISSM